MVSNLILLSKKAGKYPCVKTEHLKFMDILQFLAPGYNLKSFFKAFGVSEQKGFFPYDYFTSAEQLDETTLPPYETFYSTKNLLIKENLNEKPYKPSDYQQSQKLGLKIISEFNSSGLKVNGQFLLIISNGIMIWT